MALSVLSTLGVIGALREAQPRLEAAAGLPLDLRFDPTAKLLQRIAAGERADVAILTGEGVAALAADGTLDGGGRAALAHSFVGLAVRQGAPHPVIGSEAAVRQALLDAPSICYSRAGASGIFFATLIERLGIAEAVNRKATVIPAGLTAEPLARGEVALAVQQVSELMLVPGISIVGRLPAALGGATTFCAAPFAGMAQAGAAAALIGALRADPALWARHGLEAAGAGD